MKTLLQIKQAIKDMSALRGDDRASAVRCITRDIGEIEMAVAQDPAFMGYYEVHELKKLIGKVQGRAR